ncbi:MAG: peptidoglycan bridge formation glycyltransferase FemA/FemB family protein [Bacilli bacterium]|nr:peptidoglycan bridge formation glycyltransferase FemA/FemB family protein [Bacilli bacterium]
MLKIKEIDGKTFDEYISAKKIETPYQMNEYGKTMKLEGYDVKYIAMIDDLNSISAASLLLIESRNKIKYAYAPRGFLLEYNNIEILANFTRLIKKYLSDLGVIAVKINPLIIRKIYNSEGKLIEKNPYYDNIFNNLKKLGYIHMGYNTMFEAQKPRFEAIISLNKPYTDLFKDIKKEFRTKIRSAEESFITIHKSNYNNLRYLYLQVKNKYPRDLDYFQHLYASLKPADKIDFFYAKVDTVKLLDKLKDNYSKQDAICNQLSKDIFKSSAEEKLNVVSKKMAADHMLNVYKTQMIEATTLLKDYPDGAIAASALIVKTGEMAFVIMDGMDKTLKTFNAKHLLMWKLIERYSKLGLKRFNLGGVTDISVENAKYEGLNEFKTSFNANIFEYMGDLELITNSTQYFMYENTMMFRNIFK